MSIPHAVSLVGLKHVGKSTIGKRIARALRYSFVDTDDLLVSEYQRTTDQRGDRRTSPRDIYRNLGVDRFQHLEAQAIRRIFGQLATDEGVVIATGGGLCDNTHAFDTVTQESTIVFIDESVEAIYPRIIASGIPSFLDPTRPYEHFREIANRRVPLYRERANYTVRVQGRSLEHVGDAILALFH